MAAPHRGKIFSCYNINTHKELNVQEYKRIIIQHNDHRKRAL